MSQLKRILLLTLLFLCVPLVSLASTPSITVESVTLPKQVAIDGNSMAIKGAGVRSKFFIDLYVGSLYLSSPARDVIEIISGDSPMMIQLDIISSRINSKNMTEATLEGFDNATSGNTKAIQSQIDEFTAVFSDVITVDDVFQLIHLPEQGLVINKNGQKIKVMKKNMAFKRALFGIWLSDKPAQKSLKKEMLGL